jgi:hypothetical protein
MAVVLSVARPALAEPAPLAGTPPSASRCDRMLSGGAPTIGAANSFYALDHVHAILVLDGKCFSAPTIC